MSQPIDATYMWSCAYKTRQSWYRTLCKIRQAALTDEILDKPDVWNLSCIPMSVRFLTLHRRRCREKKNMRMFLLRLVSLRLYYWFLLDICGQLMMTSSNAKHFPRSPVTGEVPSQRPVIRGFDIFFDLRLNKRLSKQSWGWDAIVSIMTSL